MESEEYRRSAENRAYLGDGHVTALGKQAFVEHGRVRRVPVTYEPFLQQSTSPIHRRSRSGSDVCTTVFPGNTNSLKYIRRRRRIRRQKVNLTVRTLDIAPVRESSPLKRSGMARVLNGSHTFICTPTRSIRNGDEPYLPLPSQL